MTTRLLVTAFAAGLLAACANVQTAPAARASALPPVSNYADPGPFTTVVESGTGPDGTYTIVRPQTLGTNGFRHAPIIFGPGIGGPMESMVDLQRRIASHGFVIIGRQLDGGPRNAENNRRMIAGLDWLIGQNNTAGSVFAGKLDVDRAASMGYSVGGTGAVDIGAHKAIITVVSIHGHSAEAALHGTLLLLGGTKDTMGDGRSWLAPTYDASQVPTFFSLVQDANHGYPSRSVDGVQSGVEAPAMIAWLRYWIYGDQDARKYFFGDDCVLCSAPWTSTQRKNWP
ncbi:MAG: dienelactone hydrolase family protein [Pseudomonadota bacterium]|nr:dienelactone hydrolase family protein [Pseudomonadota bacterium]